MSVTYRCGRHRRRPGRLCRGDPLRPARPENRVHRDWKNQDGKPGLGGTCLNVGCIPSKALLESSENYERIRTNFAAHGITVEGLKLDVGTMLARKEKIVRTLTDGIAALFRKNKVAIIHGRASFAGGGARWKLEVQHDGKTESVDAGHVIIATGSTPRQLPQVPVDNERMVDNVGALDFKEVPKRLGIIGAGVIGLELGSVWRRLGSNVILFQAHDAFLPSVDDQIASRGAAHLYATQGLMIHRGVKFSVDQGEQEERRGRIRGQGRRPRSSRSTS